MSPSIHSPCAANPSASCAVRGDTAGTGRHHALNPAPRSGLARSASVLAVLALSLTLGACASRPTHQQLGTAAGAVVGGATGSVLFGSTLGTVAGAAAGAVVGNELSRKPRR